MKNKKMNQKKEIYPATEKDYPRLLEIWENSVTATHYFLSEDDIRSLKKMVPKYFPEVKLYLYKDGSEEISGFLGVAKNKIEMLFIDSDTRGKGIGKKLVSFAIKNLNANELDVNEQNPQAVGFYKHIGFEIIGRSELDGQGNPFPLLHMKLNRKL